MKSHVRVCLLLAVLGSSGFIFSGCGDNDEPPTASPSASAGAGGESAVVGDGSAECAVIGELCHDADTVGGPAHDCHELGHENDGAACLESFSGCITTCVTDDDSDPDADPHCAALGELCHPVDDRDGPLHECHELGHENDAEQCAAAFDDCAARCLAAREDLETETPESGGAGSGGAGGAGGSGG